MFNNIINYVQLGSKLVMWFNNDFDFVC